MKRRHRPSSVPFMWKSAASEAPLCSPLPDLNLGSLLLVQIKEICPSYKVPNYVPEVKVPQSAGNPERKHRTETKRKTLKTLPPYSSFFLLNHLISAKTAKKYIYGQKM